MSRKNSATTKRSAPKVTQLTQPNEAKMIAACIKFAQHRAAYSAGYKVDPDGDSKNATRTGEPHYGEATLALAAVALRSATTVEAIRAKSAIAGVLIEELDECGCRSDRLDVLFLTQFAKDVNQFAGRMIEEKWAAEARAAKSAA